MSIKVKLICLLDHIISRSKDQCLFCFSVLFLCVAYDIVTKTNWSYTDAASNFLKHTVHFLENKKNGPSGPDFENWTILRNMQAFFNSCMLIIKLLWDCNLVPFCTKQNNSVALLDHGFQRMSISTTKFSCTSISQSTPSIISFEK